jgi:hypothetical protein
VHRVASAPPPQLGRWSAGYPFTPDGAIDPDSPPYPTVRSPDGGEMFRWGDPRLRQALERDLRCDIDPVRDLLTPRGVIVSTQAPQDPGRAGVNVQLELAAPRHGWSGSVLSFENGVRLRLFNSRADGPGIEAIVLAGGRVQLGEIVALG